MVSFLLFTTQLFRTFLCYRYHYRTNSVRLVQKIFHIRHIKLETKYYVASKQFNRDNKILPAYKEFIRPLFKRLKSILYKCKFIKRSFVPSQQLQCRNIAKERIIFSNLYLQGTTALHLTRSSEQFKSYGSYHFHRIVKKAQVYYEVIEIGQE